MFEESSELHSAQREGPCKLSQPSQASFFGQVSGRDIRFMATIDSYCVWKYGVLSFDIGGTRAKLVARTMNTARPVICGSNLHELPSSHNPTSQWNDHCLLCPHMD